MSAEKRAWEVVRRAYEDRPPRPRRPRRRLVLIPAIAVLAAVISPPGRAVFEQVREAVGVQHADPALFALPTSGRLLVVSAEHGGVWLVHDDGFKRRIGSFDDAQWSPHGRFIVATKRDELVALDADGHERWSLARRDPLWPRWEGTDTDTRIAYFAASGLRVVAGDGTGDRLVDAHAGDVPAAWSPARLHTLAYYSGGAIVVRDVDSGRTLRRTPISVVPAELAWSDDGRVLAVMSARRVLLLGGRSIPVIGAVVDIAFRPGTHSLALSERQGGRSRIELVSGATRQLLFAGPGAFGDVAWSPDGAWLLVTWPTADQWLFLHGARVRAVGNIEEQFPRADGQGPLLELGGRWSR